jgi:ADP-ribose pyrophosphatase
MSDKAEHPRTWRVHSREGLYQGYNRLESLYFSHSSHAGDTVGPVERELFVRGNVVGLLAVDPQTNMIALVEQFRFGALERKPDPWLMEIVAGMIDTDETPEAVAIREAHEEAGLSLSSVTLAMRYLSSPGCSNEEVFLYYAETDLSGIGGTHGLAEEAEDIRVHVVPIETAYQMLDDGRICNALSIIAIQWLRLKRLGSGA